MISSTASSRSRLRFRGRLLPTLFCGLAAWSLAGSPALARGDDPFEKAKPSSVRDSESKDDDSTRSNAKKDASDASSAARTDAKDRTEKEPEHVFKTNDEWRKILSLDQFLVTRLKYTEPAFSGKYATGHYKGTFLCVCCGAKLFDADTKFDSGTGWPSFWRPSSVKALAEALDQSEAEPRVEVECSRCGAHLGHVFQDGPPPTGLRYCINSLSIKLDSESDKPTSARRATTRSTRKSSSSTKSASARSSSSKASKSTKSAVEKTSKNATSASDSEKEGPSF